MMSTKFFIGSLIIIGLLTIGFNGVVNAGQTVTQESNPPLIYFVQSLTYTPADAGTVYFGLLPKAPTTTVNISCCEIMYNGTITGANIFSYSGTAGTSENWVLYIRLKNTVDYTIATVSSATNKRIWESYALNIPVKKGDYFEIKSVQPTFATNPATTIFGGYILEICDNVNLTAVEVTDIQVNVSLNASVNVTGGGGTGGGGMEEFIFNEGLLGIILSICLFIVALFLSIDRDIWRPILLFLDVPISLATGIYYVSSSLFSVSWWVGVVFIVFAVLLSMGGLYYGLSFGRHGNKN